MHCVSYRRVMADLPVHLQAFCVEANHLEYTAEQQLIWRFIIDRLRVFLAKRGHPAVTAGFRRFAIDPDHIPHIDEINAGLAEVGWCAVLVDGFLPPVVFMEFQAHKVLPISADMRSLDHVTYTPAPDIVHEAAGHAPMLADPEYRAFLQRVGECGTKTLWNAADDAVYRAVRALSIAKEHPNADDREVAAATLALERAVAAQRAQPPSEAARLARLHWWTVEYGLIGALDAPRIFGAGLVSSLLESRHCLAPGTVRLPLSEECLDDDYDITAVQPHYYVAPDWQALHAVLDAFEATCAFHVGGLEGVRRAIEHGTCATAEYANGLQLTGRFERALVDDRGALAYITTAGACELAHDGRALAGPHVDGLGAPVGELEGTDVVLGRATPAELGALGIRCGASATLRFASRVVVSGQVVGLARVADRNLLLDLDGCTVTAPDGTLVFAPGSGRYRMAMGGSIVSVFGGPGDRRRLVPGGDPAVTGLTSSLRERPVRYSATQRYAETLYARLRQEADPAAVYRELCRLEGDKWLMLMEIYEAALRRGDEELGVAVRTELAELAARSPDKSFLIEEGFARLGDQRPATA